MYFEHFGLHRPPFEETTNPAFYFEPAHHSTILDQVMASVEAGGVVLITGPHGSGKSVLGQVLLKRLGEETKVLSFSAPPDGPQCGIRRICTGFGIESPVSATAEQCVAQLLNVIASRSHKRCVVLIDQAEYLSADDLLALHRLLHSAGENRIRLAIVMRATPAIDATLRLPELKLFAQSLVRTPSLERLDAHETERYLARRIEAAGGSIKRVFSPEAISRIAAKTGGWPRKINALAKQALVCGESRQLHRVDEDTIVACCKETEEMDDHDVRSTGGNDHERGADREVNNETVDGASARLRAEVDRVVNQAITRIENACASSERAVSGAIRADDSACRLEQAAERAEAVISRIEEAQRNLSRVGRSAEERVSLLLSSLDAAQTIQERIEQVGSQVTGLVEESQRSALAEQDKLGAIFEDVSRRRDELAETLDQMKRAVATIQSDRETVLDESRRLLHDVKRTQTEVNAQMEAISSQTADYSARVASMNEAQHRAARVVDAATEAARRVEAGLDRTAAASRELDEGANRVAEQMASFQSIVTDHKDARNRAEQSVRTARMLIEKVAESEARLTDAQQAAVDIEAISSSSLTTVQKQVKRLEESVEVVVRHGVDKARAQLAEAVSEAASRIETVRAEVDHASTQLTDRMRAACVEADSQMSAIGEIVEQAHADVHAAAEHQIELANSGIGTAATEAIAQVSSELTRCVASAVQRGESIANDATARIETRADELRESNLAAIADRLRMDGAAIQKTAIAAMQEAATATIDAVRSDMEAMSDTASQSVRLQMNEVAQATSGLADAVARNKAEIEEMCDKATSAMHEREAATLDAVRRAQTQLEDSCAETITSIRETEAVTLDSVRRARVEMEHFCEKMNSAIRETETAVLDNVRIESDTAATNATERITELVQAAAQSDEQLTATVTQARQAIAEGDTCREKIDHLIRDVWSLTSTTDQRVRSLEALVQNAQNIEENIAKAVEEAKAQIAKMSNQSAAAQQHTATLSEQQNRVRETCEAFAQRIAEARKAGGELNDANMTAKRLVTEMAGSTSQIGERIETAKTLVETIRTDDEKVQKTSAALAKLGVDTQAAESRLVELQQGLANPMVTIEEARAQADELNDICLAVKRVFRGVSQASLQADERLKQLGQMLAVAERTALTMQQWVAEAGRAQERLAKTLSGTPSIADTHPITAMPDMTKMPYPAELKGANIDATDRATLQRLAAATRREATGVANPSQRTKAPAAAPKTAKQVQPLVEALKARQASQGTQAAKNPNRLSAEQVRALIAKAQKEAAPQA